MEEDIAPLNIKPGFVSAHACTVSIITPTATHSLDPAANNRAIGFDPWSGCGFVATDNRDGRFGCEPPGKLRKQRGGIDPVDGSAGDDEVDRRFKLQVFSPPMDPADVLMFPRIQPSREVEHGGGGIDTDHLICMRR